MARSGARSPRQKGQSAASRVVDATIEALKQQGFAGASAREIARIGGFAQGVVFYHFGTMNDLLLAALDRTAEERMACYRDAVDGVGTLPELVAVAADIYRQDLEAGHIKVLAELIAASSSEPELGAGVSERIEPWVDFTAEVLGRFVAGSPLAGFVPVRDAAFAIVALYLGVELLTHLKGDMTPAESLIASATSLTNQLSPLFTASPSTASPPEVPHV